MWDKLNQLNPLTRTIVIMLFAIPIGLLIGHFMFQPIPREILDQAAVVTEEEEQNIQNVCSVMVSVTSKYECLDREHNRLQRYKLRKLAEAQGMDLN